VKREDEQKTGEEEKRPTDDELNEEEEDIDDEENGNANCALICAHHPGVVVQHCTVHPAHTVLYHMLKEPRNKHTGLCACFVAFQVQQEWVGTRATHTAVVGHGHVSRKSQHRSHRPQSSALPNKHENVGLILNRLLELSHITSCAMDFGSNQRRTQVLLTMASTFWTVVSLSLPMKSYNTPREVTLQPLQDDLHQTTSLHQQSTRRPYFLVVNLRKRPKKNCA